MKHLSRYDIGCIINLVTSILAIVTIIYDAAWLIPIVWVAAAASMFVSKSIWPGLSGIALGIYLIFHFVFI